MTNNLDTPLNKFVDLDALELSRSGKGKDVLLGVATVFFFEDGTQLSRRRDSLSVLENYAKFLPTVINCWYPPGGRGSRPIGENDIWAKYGAFAETEPTTEKSGASVSGYATPKASGDATHFQGRAFWNDEWSRWSDVRLLQSAAVLDDPGPQAFVTKVLEWCDILKPSHGTAGLSLLPNFGFGITKHSATAWPLIQRFAGLDWPDSGGWAIETRDDPNRHIRTVNWLTILDDAFVKRLNGEEKLRALLAEDCIIHPWEGGILIQAGPVPVLGDVNKGEVPDSYRSTSKATAPLRFEDFRDGYGVFYPPKPLSPGGESKKWVTRFD